MLSQSEPDVMETSDQASGPAKGKITRNSPEFNKLEACYNTGIIFKDEEGTGADRLMSKVKRLSFVYILYLPFYHVSCVVYTHQICHDCTGVCDFQVVHSDVEKTPPFEIDLSCQFFVPRGADRN